MRLLTSHALSAVSTDATAWLAAELFIPASANMHLIKRTLEIQNFNFKIAFPTDNLNAMACKQLARVFMLPIVHILL
jgi:hypothetical protein